jgi:hypothetical protein
VTATSRAVCTRPLAHATSSNSYCQCNSSIMSTSSSGFERIVRYCLLRFIHLNGLNIDGRPDSDESAAPRATE